MRKMLNPQRPNFTIVNSIERICLQYAVGFLECGNKIYRSVYAVQSIIINGVFNFFLSSWRNNNFMLSHTFY